MALASLHHVTCVCADARRTAAFYRDELGFSLVKKTVNFDDPHSYHLYFGDEDASPGSLLTFFEWPRAERGRLGRGTFESIGLVSPRVQTEWQLEDPDGLRLRVLPGERPGLHDVVAIGNPLLYAGLLDDAPITFAPPSEEVALIGPGTTHHIAVRAADDAEQALWRDRLDRARTAPDPGAGPPVLPLDLLPHARRDPARDRNRRPRVSSSTSRPRRSARRSHCRRGSRRSGRRSNASSPRSADSTRSPGRALDCRPHALVAELVDAQG